MTISLSLGKSLYAFSYANLPRSEHSKLLCLYAVYTNPLSGSEGIWRTGEEEAGGYILASAPILIFKACFFLKLVLINPI